MGVVIYLFVAIICGVITGSINKSKGYNGGFAWGFFLGIIGIIVVAVRPFNSQKTADSQAPENVPEK